MRKEWSKYIRLLFFKAAVILVVRKIRKLEDLKYNYLRKHNLPKYNETVATEKAARRGLTKIKRILENESRSD